MKFVKIIYFDESTVADFMQIISGGEFKKTTEFISNVNTDLGVDAEMNADVDTDKKGLPKLFSFLSGITLNTTVKGNADINRKSEKIARNILENTLLADFLDLIGRDERKKEKNKLCSSIKLFEDLTLHPEKNSFSFLMLAAPFFTMLDGDVPIPGADGSNFNLDVSKIEDAIARGRGYYEFITCLEEKEVIFRFNSSAFRNNYTMSDLPKMQLYLYAIYVGRTDKKRLDISNEFQFGTPNKSRADYVEASAADEVVELEVYDVVLAGIIEK